MDTTPASADAWQIEDLPDGWNLDVRFRVPLAWLLPRYMRCNTRVFFLILSLYLTIGLGGVGAAAAGALWAGDTETALYFAVRAPLAVAGAVALTALVWPLRYSRSPAPSEDCYLRYFQANRRHTVRVSRSSIHVRAGMFSLHHLETLAVTDVDSYLGRYDLVFQGVHTPAGILGWPGVPRADAEAMREAILSRLGQGFGGPGSVSLTRPDG